MLDSDSLLSLLAEEFSYSVGGEDSDQVEAERRSALNYYLGGPNGKEVEGRSSVVSTDVADAIEWILPQVMESLTANNEVVIFDPSFEGDEKQAELESSYVYDILMKQNPGFVILHYMAKDALMQKNGFLEIYYTADDFTREEKFTGLDQMSLALVQQDQSCEITEMEEYIEDINGAVQPFYNVTISHTYTKGQIVIDPVPQEEFRVSRGHRNVDVGSARFASRLMYLTRSDLKNMGVDPDLVDSLPAHNVENDTERQYRHIYEGQYANPIGGNGQDPSQDEIECARCVLRADIDGTGIAKLHKILVAGGENPTEILLEEEIDESPFVNCVAILMSHTVNGLSIYDRLKQIQDQKTALLRSNLDNIYLQNNQRTGIVEGMANIDDLLLSRPGGIVRVKHQDAIFPIVTPPIGQDAQHMMEYLDRIRAGRVGVSPEGAAQPQRLGEDIGSEGVDRLMTASEALVGLIVRVIAETGVKPICLKVRNLARKHQDAISQYKFKGVWYDINPAQWMDRTNTTIRVGTGTGDRNRQIQALSVLAQFQEKILMNPQQALVDEPQVYNLINDLAKFSGLTGIHKYFIDPASQEGQQSKQQKAQQAEKEKEQQDALEQTMAQAQAILAQAEKIKADADMQSNMVKMQNEQLKNEINGLKIQLEDAQKSEDLTFKYEELYQNVALKLTELEQKGEEQERKQQENVRAIK